MSDHGFYEQQVLLFNDVSNVLYLFAKVHCVCCTVLYAIVHVLYYVLMGFSAFWNPNKVLFCSVLFCSVHERSFKKALKIFH